MNRKDFHNVLKNKILFLDGGYGTEFIKRGHGNIISEMLNIKNPQVVEQLQKEYVLSGSDILLTNTFSANRYKLRELGYEEFFEQINVNAVKISRKASNSNTLVFGDISSTGEFIKPMGNLDFEDAVSIFQEQAKILYENGVDGFIVETMSDIKELKAAVIGIRNISQEIPLIVHMTFDKDLRCVTGTSVKIFATVFDDLDVDVIGINCTLGPDEMREVFQELSKYTNKFLSVEPNAGKPDYVDGITKYSMTPETFGIFVEDYINMGANIIGGCCGSTPEHIKYMKKLSENYRPVVKNKKIDQSLSSRTIYVDLNPFLSIGERINPASRKYFQTEIENYDYSTFLKEAKDQEKEMSKIIDVNFGIEKILNEEHFKRGILELDKISSIPISFDIQNSKYLETALKEYPGRPLINSSKVTMKSMDRKIELLKKYGGMLILLAMGKEIAETPEERYKTILEGIKYLEENGISRDRVYADPLIMSLGAKADPKVALNTIEMLSNQNIKTVAGLSNLSFGLPERSLINGAYLSQAVGFGLKAAIMNTGDTFVMGSLKGSLIINDVDYIEEKKSYDNIFIESMLEGNSEKLINLIEETLKEKSPLEISQNILGKALEEIGIMYSKGELYLPHLLLAAETSKPAFDYLNGMLTEKKTYKGKVILATVEGDIHDIGKKIIGTVLKSGGYDVVDIGKDVKSDMIIEKVIEENPDILGLSAMMTTTIEKVEEVSKLLKEKEIKKILIAGGASMNKKIAEKFGCDGYAQNASQVVELCDKLIKAFE